MDRNEALSAFEKSFATTVVEYVPYLRAAVGRLLVGSERKIFDLAMNLYSNDSGRWWDLWHLPETRMDLMAILREEQAHDSDAIVAKIAFDFHDSGYPKLRDSAAYSSQDMREFHSRQGANNAMQLLSTAVADGEYLVNKNHLAVIADAILHHDDKFFNPHSDMALSLCYLVDADTSFIPSFVSMYKDYVVKYSRPGLHHAMSGRDFLHLRAATFFSQEEQRRFGITNSSAADYDGKRIPVHFDSTKRIMAAHFNDRAEELDNGLFQFAFDGDWSSFRPYANAYLEQKIEKIANIRV